MNIDVKLVNVNKYILLSIGCLVLKLLQLSPMDSSGAVSGRLGSRLFFLVMDDLFNGK